METQNNVSEIKEPTPKIQKLMLQNGVCEDATIPFLRVNKLSQKAILPQEDPLSLPVTISQAPAQETKVPGQRKGFGSHRSKHSSTRGDIWSNSTAIGIDMEAFD